MRGTSADRAGKLERLRQAGCAHGILALPVIDFGQAELVHARVARPVLGGGAAS